jgi:dethiobiotin synthetase
LVAEEAELGFRKSYSHAIIESAGGLFVPIAPHRLFADLAAQLGLPTILVTYDGLGTLSHTLATPMAGGRLT